MASQKFVSNRRIASLSCNEFVTVFPCHAIYFNSPTSSQQVVRYGKSRTISLPWDVSRVLNVSVGYKSVSTNSLLICRRESARWIRIKMLTHCTDGSLTVIFNLAPFTSKISKKESTRTQSSKYLSMIFLEKYAQSPKKLYFCGIGNIWRSKNPKIILRNLQIKR